MSKSKRLSRTDWLEAALTTLVKDGIEGVRVERLARDLGVTKGNFYWHFEDRPDLLRGLLDYWIEKLTTVVIDVVSRVPSGNLRERLGALDAILSEMDGRDAEMAIKAWSHVDARVREVMSGVEKQRRDFVKGLFIDGGFSEEEAEVRARLFAAYRMASWLTALCDEGERDGRLTEIRLRLLTEK